MEDYHRPGTGVLGGGSDGAGQEEDMIRLKYAGPCGRVARDANRAVGLPAKRGLPMRLNGTRATTNAPESST